MHYYLQVDFDELWMYIVGPDAQKIIIRGRATKLRGNIVEYLKTSISPEEGKKNTNRVNKKFGRDKKKTNMKW